MKYSGLIRAAVTTASAAGVIALGTIMTSAGAATTTPNTATISVLRSADAAAQKLVTCTYGATVPATADGSLPSGTDVIVVNGPLTSADGVTATSGTVSGDTLPTPAQGGAATDATAIPSGAGVINVTNNGTAASGGVTVTSGNEDVNNTPSDSTNVASREVPVSGDMSVGTITVQSGASQGSDAECALAPKG